MSRNATSVKWTLPWRNLAFCGCRTLWIHEMTLLHMSRLVVGAFVHYLIERGVCPSKQIYVKEGVGAAGGSCASFERSLQHFWRSSGWDGCCFRGMHVSAYVIASLSFFHCVLWLRNYRFCPLSYLANLLLDAPLRSLTWFPRDQYCSCTIGNLCLSDVQL